MAAHVPPGRQGPPQALGQYLAIQLSAWADHHQTGFGRIGPRVGGLQRAAPANPLQVIGMARIVRQMDDAFRPQHRCH